MRALKKFTKVKNPFIAKIRKSIYALIIHIAKTVINGSWFFENDHWIYTINSDEKGE